VLCLVVLCLYPLTGTSAELSEVPGAPRFELSLPDLNGQQHNLKEFSGKVLLINFWASWCRPCIEEMPSIQRLAERLRDRPFTVIGINVAEGERRAQATVKRLGIRFPVLHDKDSSVFHKWEGTVLPTTYILDQSGVARYVGIGPMEWDGQEVLQIIESLMAVMGVKT
jgi:thiol-disulfide isomerase/thioredoxin